MAVEILESEDAESSAADSAVISNGCHDRTASFYIPDEIKLAIIERIPHNPSGQDTLYRLSMLDHEWYACTVARLYEHPLLTGKNFELFARTLCPSINLHVRKSALAPLVRHLDMRMLVHHSTRSLTARLIGRTKSNLEEFRAPAASFAINSMAALANCPQLRFLDLTNVNGSALFADIVTLLGHVPRLERFRFPRMAYTDGTLINASMDLRWPPALTALTLAGGIPLATFMQIAMHGLWPPRLRRLDIEHCQALNEVVLARLLQSLPASVAMLRLGYLGRVAHKDLDGLLAWVPAVRHLDICLEYMTAGFFERPDGTLLDHPLLSLALDTHSERTLDYGAAGCVPLTIGLAIRQGRVPHLARVTISDRLRHSDKRWEVDEADLDPAVRAQHEMSMIPPELPASGGGSYGTAYLIERLEDVEDQDEVDGVGIFAEMPASQDEDMRTGYFI
jgi:hypothetical protein